MSSRYLRVALRAEHRCEYCHAPEAVFNFPLEVEHITPIARDGEDAPSNWALACRSCNLYKAAHLSGTDPESAAVARLYHPRKDRWEDHFQAAPESGEILGRTPIGRATVARLEINSTAQHGAGRSPAAVDAPRPVPLIIWTAEPYSSNLLRGAGGSVGSWPSGGAWRKPAPASPTSTRGAG